MRRGFPLLFCLLALTSATPAHATAPFELDTKVDYAGLRCITGPGRVALVVGVHYRDVQERFEQISYLVKHVAELHATVRGASRSMRLGETVRIPVGLWGRRNVDHRHT